MSLGRRAVELGPRDHALVQQPLHPLEVQARQIALRFGRGQLRPLLPRVEPTSTSPSRTAWPESNAMRSTVPGQVGAHRDALHGGDRADRAQRRRPLVLLRHDRRHRFGRRLERRPLRDRRLNLLELHEPEAGDDHGHHDQHENHAFHHGDRYGKFPSTSGTRHNAEKTSKLRADDMRVTAVPADASAPCRNVGAAWLVVGSWWPVAKCFCYKPLTTNHQPQASTITASLLHYSGAGGFI